MLLITEDKGILIKNSTMMDCYKSEFTFKNTNNQYFVIYNRILLKLDFPLIILINSLMQKSFNTKQ